MFTKSDDNSSTKKKNEPKSYRETWLYVTLNDIDSWTDEFFSFISQVRQNKLTEQGLTIVKIRNNYAVKKVLCLQLECR